MTMDIEDVVAALESAEPAAEEPNADEVAQPEAKEPAEEVAQGAEGTDENNRVNYGALHEERGKRKELEDQLSSATQRMTRMEQTFAKVMKDVSPDEKPSTFPIEPAQSPGQAPPSYEEDPGGHLLGQVQQLTQRVQTLTEQREQDATAQRQSGAQDAMMRRATVEVNSYKTVQPDWNDAYQHLLTVNTEQLSAQGYAPDQVAQIMGQMERNIIGMAHQAGVNPGKRLYEAAVANGYVKNGTPAPTPPGERIQTLAAQAIQTQSLGDAAAAPTAPGAGTLQHLATLQGAEFDALWNTMKRQGKL